MTTFTELTTPRTADEITTAELATLAAAGFPVDAWAVGGAARGLVRADAVALAQTDTNVATLASAATLSGATEDWLDLFVASRFDLTRLAASYAVGEVQLTVASGAGPFSVPAGGLLVSDGVRRWRSTEAIGTTITSAAPTTFSVRAEVAGTDGNGNNNTITSILSPALPGVTCNNPVVGATSTWLTTVGVARESDAALRARAVARWATLAFGAGTRAAYEYVLRSATMDNTETGTSCGVTRVGFIPSPGTGAVGIAIAGASGLLTDSQRNAVRVFVADRSPLTDTPTVDHASTVAVNMSTSTVKFRAGLNTLTNQSKVQTAISAYVNALPMGDGTSDIFVDEEAIAASIFAAVPGLLVDVDLGTGDIAIPALTVATVDTSTINFLP